MIARVMRYSGAWLLTVLATTLICAVPGTVPAQASSPQQTINRTVAKFREVPGIKPFFGDAYAYAVYPSIIKGGFIVGGGTGHGAVFRNGTFTGTSKLHMISAGAQLGIQSYSQIIFFENREAYENFIRDGSYTFSADANAVLVTMNANAKAGSSGISTGTGFGKLAENTRSAMHGMYTNGMVVFITDTAGLMAEASLGGEQFTFTPKDKMDNMPLIAPADEP